MTPIGNGIDAQRGYLKVFPIVYPGRDGSVLFAVHVHHPNVLFREDLFHFRGGGRGCYVNVFRVHVHEDISVYTGNS